MWSKAHRCFVEEGSVFGGPDGCVCVCLCVSVNVLMRPGGMHALADVCVCVCAIKRWLVEVIELSKKNTKKSAKGKCFFLPPGHNI